MTYTIIKNGTQTVKTVSVPQNYSLEVEQLGRCITDGEKPLVSREFTIGTLRTIGKILEQIGYSAYPSR